MFSQCKFIHTGGKKTYLGNKKKIQRIKKRLETEAKFIIKNDEIRKNTYIHADGTFLFDYILVCLTFFPFFCFSLTAPIAKGFCFKTFKHLCA